MAAVSSPAQMTLAGSSAEFDILRAAILHEPLPLPSEPRWDHLLLAADYHGILWRLTQALKTESVPEPVRQVLAVGERGEQQRSMMLTSQMLWVHESFHHAGISVIPYKGPVLAEQLYDDPMERSFTDLDFLILKEQLAEARKVLFKIGFRPDPDIAERLDDVLVRVVSAQNFLGEPPVRLELAWSLAPHQFSFHGDTAAMVRRARPTRFHDIHVLSLTPEDTLLALAVHASKHAWCRLMWLNDISRALQKCPDVDYVCVLAMAREAGVLRLVLATFELVRMLLAAPLPQALQEAIAQDHAATATALVVAERMTQAVSRGLDLEPAPAWRHRVLLGAREDAADRRRYLWRLLFTPADRQLAIVTLPRPFYFGYSTLRCLEVVAKSSLAILPARRSGHGYHPA
jgi:putative nucleotidyltransferase-like protein